jgi:hypothetical protein
MDDSHEIMLQKMRNGMCNHRENALHRNFEVIHMFVQLFQLAVAKQCHMGREEDDFISRHATGII